VPIGKPIDNVLLYLLNPELDPSTESGEIYIGGDYALARGYSGHPALTSERFIPDPNNAGKRLFRTGDVAIHNEEKDLCFLGRTDHQVKIYGQRVELPEVEHRIRQYEAVSEVVVEARDILGTGRQLVAFIVPTVAGSVISTAVLRDFVGQSLPKYMIPSFFQFLKDFPHLPNGKIDRLSLPTPLSGEARRQETPYAAPRNSTEGAMVDIWQQVFRIQSGIGINDDFFSLGGDSIVGIRLVSRANKAGIKIETAHLFECYTIRSIFDSYPHLLVLSQVDDTAGKLVVRANVEWQKRYNSETVALLKGKYSGIEDVYSMTSVQEGMYFHSLLHPHSQQYIPQMVWKLNVGSSDAVNLELFKNCWSQVLHRHHIFRTHFVSLPSESSPLQVVARDPKDIDELWQEYHWRSGISSSLEEMVTGFMSQDLNSPFRLESKTPMRFTVILSENQDTCYFIWTHHHIVVDGWSAALVVSEVNSLYRLEGDGSRLPSPVPFADYVHWVKDSRDSEAEKSFWTAYLKGFDTPSPLPYALPSVDGAVPVFADHEITLSPQETAQISRAARDYRVTVSTIIQAAWAWQLSICKGDGDSDVVFGVTASGRAIGDLEGVEKMVGMTINTLPTRVRVEGGRPINEWLTDIQSQQIKSSKYEQSSLVDVLRWSDLRKEHRNLFDSIVVFENFPSSWDDEGEVSKVPPPLESMNMYREFTNFDLTLLSLLDQKPQKNGDIEERLVLRLMCNQNRYNHASANQVLQRIRVLLTSLSGNMKAPLGTSLFASTTEVAEVLENWNKTDAPQYISEDLIFDQFRKIARKYPDSTALVIDDEHLSFQELDRRSELLCNYLISVGVTTESKVAVRLNRSVELMVALIGITKAGAAYVPVDPTYPVARQEYIMRDAKAHVLITASDSGDVSGVSLIILTEHWQQIVETQSSQEAPKVSASNAMYIIYTSGSTGNPKGVMLQHRGLTNRLWSMADLLINKEAGGRIREQPSSFRWHRVLQKTSVCFDVSVWELFLPLVTGCCLVLLEPNLEKDPNAIVKTISQHAITTLHFVPTMLNVFVNSNKDSIKEECQSIAFVVTSGEALDVSSASLIQSLVPTVRVVNYYGPTEATIDVTVHIYNDESDSTGYAVPIGKPIENTKVFVLDTHFNLLPPGVAGELYLSGEQLARGYLGRPDLTADKFVPNPFCSVAGSPFSRMYATGDLTRYRTDGTVEYIGRRDNQVKIRGFRIELGEVEEAVRQHEWVSDCKVLVLLVGLSKQIVAYAVVPNEKLEMPSSDLTKVLREWTQEKLTSYMVPAYFIFLDKFPLFPNGKLNIKELPHPSALSQEEQSNVDRLLVPPQDIVEARLLDIWKEALGHSNISTTDNFFEIGGDSIISIRIVSKAVQLGLSIKVKDMFDHPTIARLARAINSGRKEIAQASPAEQCPVVGPSPLGCAQQWFFDKQRPASLSPKKLSHWNQAQLIRVHGNIPWENFVEIVQGLLSHHDILRARYSLVKEHWEQYIGGDIGPDGLHLPVERVNLQDVEQQDKRLQEEIERVQASLDIVEGPVVRFALISLSSAQSVVFIAAHHLVMDGVSWRILLEDFETLYHQHPLPAKTHSFPFWTRRLMQHEVSSDELHFWRDTLSRSRPLFAGEKYQEKCYFNAGTSRVIGRLSVQETSLLLTDLLKLYHAQINDVLVTAFVLSFLEWKGGKEFTFTAEGHGREDLFEESVDVSRTIGWFTSMYPVHISLDTHSLEDINACLKSVKEQLRRIPNRGIGFSLGNKGSNPALEQVYFNFMGKFDNVYKEGDLELTSATDPVVVASSEGKDTVVTALIEMNGIVGSDGCAEFEWKFVTELFPEEEVREHLSSRFLQILKKFISFVGLEAVAKVGGYTPSDFPLLRPLLSQESLDLLLASGRDIIDIYPLTPLQEGMLFHTLKEPNEQLYITQISWPVILPSIPVFKKAWSTLIERHTILRTSFAWEGLERPIQLVHLPFSVDVVWKDLDYSSHDDEEQKKLLASYCLSDRVQGFDLSRPGLLRLTLVNIGKGSTYRFIFTHHHLYLDGWSVANLLNEILAICNYGTVLPPVSPFRDYVNILLQRDTDKAKQFWSNELKYLEAPLQLPRPIHKLPTGEDKKNEWRELLLPVELVSKIHAFLKAHQFTLNTLVQAVWGLILHAMTREQSVVFGCTYSGRSFAGGDIQSIGEMVGMFINSLPVTLRVSGEQDIFQFLKQVQEKHIQINEFEDSSLLLVKSCSSVPSGVSLFESLVVVENYPADKYAPSADAASYYLDESDRIEFERTNFPLTWAISVSGTGEPSSSIGIKAMYDGTKLEECFVETMLNLWQRLTEQIVAQQVGKSLCLGDFSYVDEAQPIQAESLPFEFGADDCLHVRFEMTVERTPDAIAIFDNDEQLTYRGLNERANKLARFLRELGVGMESIVALDMKRSIEVYVCMLATLKLGAGYLAIEPTFPVERKLFLLSNSNACLLLVRGSYDHPKAIDVLSIDLKSYSGENILARVSPQSSAYYIYTSGSTGVPKGVKVFHAAVVKAVDSWVSLWQITSTIRYLQRTTLVFDFCVPEIYCPFIYGGALVILPSEDEKDMELLQTKIEREYITHIDLVPTMFTAFYFLDPEFRKLGSLRTICCGGEAPTAELLSSFKSGPISPYLLHCYGPTECVVITHLHRSSYGDKLYLPIGPVLSYRNQVIIDKHGRLLPRPLEGELCIGGALAGGYLNLPSRTAAAWVPNPYCGNPGSRMYRTGDLCRVHPDDEVQVVGRIDDQVKVRGYRIELGEIEVLMKKHQSVADAAAVIHQLDGQNNIFAYVVPSATVPYDRREFRRYLAKYLPSYMVPSAIIELEVLPLNNSGKLNKSALPKVDEVSRNSDRDFTDFMAPQTALEITLAEIFSVVLHTEQISVNDNFFELGGDSIVSIKVVSRARAAGVALTIRQIFEHPTVAELSQHVKLLHPSSSTTTTTQEKISGRVERLPISDWFFRQSLSDGHHFNQAELLCVSSNISSATIKLAMENLIRHHDILRLTCEGGNQLFIREELPVDEQFFKVEKADVVNDQAAFREVVNHAHASMNLQEGLLVRVVHFVGEGPDSYILIVIHHLSVDGVSWRILFEDLEKALLSLEKQERLSLPPKTISVIDWAKAVKQRANDPSWVAKASPYWESQCLRERSINPSWLSISDSFSSLLKRNKLTGEDLLSHHFELDEEMTRLLVQHKVCTRAFRAQIDEVLVCAYALSFLEWQQLNGGLVPLTLEGHGRESHVLAAEEEEELDISRTVGWFTTMYPVVLAIADRTNVVSVLKEVKEQLRSIPHKGMDYGMLTSFANRKDLLDSSISTVASSVSFNYLGQFDNSFGDSEVFRPVPKELEQDVFLASVSKRNAPYRVLDINGSVREGKLRFTFEYVNLLSHVQIEALASLFLTNLQSLVQASNKPAHLSDPSTIPVLGLSPSDFPLAASYISQNQLDKEFASGFDTLETIFPLTPLQEGMLFDTMREPHEELYVTQLVWQLDEGLDYSLFLDCFERLFYRYSSLRSHFLADSFDRPVQVVTRNPRGGSWVSVEAITVEGLLEDFLREDRKRGFEFGTKTPLMRFYLVKKGSLSFFVWTHHHLHLDGWSLSIVKSDLLSLYLDGLLNGSKSKKTDKETKPFGEYIGWMYRTRKEEVIRAFWGPMLRDFAAPTPLPRRRVAQKAEFTIAKSCARLSAKVTDMMNLFSRDYHITINTILQAAWALILFSYSREDRVVFGSTVSGRTEQFESTVGMLINTIPCVVTLNPYSNVIDWLKEIQLRGVESRENALTSLGEIASLSSLPKRASLFDSLLIYENYPVSEEDYTKKDLRMKALVTSLEAEMVFEKTSLPLTILAEMERHEGQQLLRVMMLATSHAPEDLQALQDELQVVIGQLIHAGSRAVGELSLIDNLSTLREINDTEEPFDEDITIAEKFANIARAQPDAIALTFEDEQLSYRELDRRIGKFSSLLLSLGVLPDQKVAVCMSRSIELIVSLGAIARVGATYVPVDPTYPPDRRRYMIEDSGVAFVIVGVGYVDFEPPLVNVVLISPNMLGDPNVDLPCLRNDEVLKTPRYGLYTIYTSGSTGRPKGVVLHHKGLVNRLGWMKKNLLSVKRGYSATPYHIKDMRALQKTSICFDVSVWELWLPIIEGGHMLLSPQGLEKEPQAIAEYMATYNVTALHFVPSMLAAFLHHTTETSAITNACSTVDYMIASGEGLPTNIASLVHTLSPHTAMLNYYGPTEATIDVSWHLYQNSDNELDTVPIGVPIDNTQLWVLDKQLNVVPVGVPGELYLGGVQLARVYHNRPDLTATRFIPNPLGRGGKEESRLYATGDLCKYNSCGEVEYLGRIDFQVKIRGFRIELGEIEALIRSHPSIKEAVVIARSLSDSKGDLKLVAYFTNQSASQLSGTDIKAFIADKIPSYMVPSFFVPMESFPTSANGKLERNLLPDPRQASASISHFESPVTERERVLCGIIGEVLKTKSPLGTTDNFFELGGDSILSIAVVAKAKAVGLGISIKLLFEYPTVKELAYRVTEVKTASYTQNTPFVGEIVPSPIQHWFLQEKFQHPHHFNQSQIVDLEKNITIERLREVAKLLSEQHDMLRLYITEQGSYATKPVADTSVLVTQVDLGDVSDGDLPDKIINAVNIAQSSLDLSSGQIVHFLHVLLGGKHTDNKLVMVVHHIAIDGVSWHILIEDLNLLTGGLAVEEYKRRPRTVSFSTWNRLCKEYAMTNPHLSFWKDVLRRSSSSCLFGDQKSFPVATFHQLKNVNIELEADVSSKLSSSVCKKFYAQINDVLLTAFVAAIIRKMDSSRGTDKRSISFTMEGHGRESQVLGDVDISHTIGWFTSMFPVCLTVPRELAVESRALGHLLKLVKEQLREIPHSGVGYGMLKYFSASSRDALLEDLPARAGEFLSSLTCFNYLGRVQSSFFDQVLGDMVSPHNRVYRLLDVNGFMVDSKLQFSFTYPEKILEAKVVEELAYCFKQVLEDLVKLGDSGSGGHTPSDFSLLVKPANSQTLVTQEQLDFILQGKEHHIVDIFPLTPMQEGLLFHAVKDRGSEMYVTQLMWTIKNNSFDPTLFKNCWQRVVDRHPIFRTYFLYSDGLDLPLQVVVDHVFVDSIWKQYTWAKDQGGGNRKALEDFLREDRVLGFDPTSVPLMRFHVVNDTEANVWYFVWTHHHLYLDGWSLAITASEVWSLYFSSLKCTLPRITPFRDYVSWYLTRDMNEAQIFWEEKLKNITSLTPLPGSTQTYLPSATQCHNHQLPFTKELMAASRRFGVTLHTLFEAVWALTLSTYSRESTVVFGTTVSGRAMASQSGVEGVVGLCINTLPMEITISPGQSLGDWLKAIQQYHLSVVQFEYTPIVKMQSWSKMQKGLSLYESIIVFENYPVDDAADETFMSTVSMEAFEKINFPLSVNFGFEKDQVVISIFYDVSRFTKSGIQTLATAIGNTLQACVTAAANFPVADLAISTGSDYEVTEPIDNFSREFDGLLLHEALEINAKRIPDAIAFFHEEDMITWGELNRRANQLAHLLRGYGVQPGSFVGVFFERSIELYIAILAVLKVGAAYIALDKDWPAARIEQVVTITKARLILTHKPQVQKTFDFVGVSWILIDLTDLSVYPAQDLQLSLSADLPMYIIFTSGSTGTPKGITMSHRGFSYRLKWFLEELNLLTPDHIGLHSCTIAFDLSCIQIYSSFFTGHASVLLSLEKELPLYIDFIQKYQISFIAIVPSAFGVIVDLEEPLVLRERVQTLKVVIIGGEAVPPHSQVLWHDPFWGPLLFNCYGPTEACMVTNTYNGMKHTRGECFSVGPTSSVHDKEYVLDQYSRPVPPGVPGELVLSSSCLSAGYFQNPIATAKAFLPDSLTGKSGARIYATGDLVIMQKSTYVAFINRIDFQVKIRGFRIELGEVEADEKSSCCQILRRYRKRAKWQQTSYCLLYRDRRRSLAC